MPIAHYNQHCYQCNCNIEKGDSIRLLWMSGRSESFCIPCGDARQTNRNKAAKKRKQNPRLPIEGKW